MRGCHTCRSRCVSGSGCLGPLPPPVPPAPLLLPPPLPAPAPLLPLPLLPPPLPPLPRPPPAFSGEALRASGGGGGGGSRLRVVVRSLHPSQPRHLHQEPESASAPRTRDRRSREHAQERWRGARAQCWSDGLHHCTHCAVGVSWLCSDEHELAAPAAGGIGRQAGDQDPGIKKDGLRYLPTTNPVAQVQDGAHFQRTTRADLRHRRVQSKIHSPANLAAARATCQPVAAARRS